MVADERALDPFNDGTTRCRVATQAQIQTTGSSSPAVGAEPGTGVRNQLLCRELNEQISALADRFGMETDLELVCECASGECFQRLPLSRADYESIRRFPTRFLVKAGHACNGTERIVAENQQFVMVEKVGADAAKVIIFDPRRRR